MHYRSSSRNTWEALDEFLESWKLCRKHVAKDASCLFRAVAEQVMLSQSHHLELRDLCATYIRLHPDQVQPLLSRPVEEHVQRLLDTTVFGGPAELYAIAHIFKAEVVVYQETPGNGFAGHMVASCSPLQTAVEKIQLATSHTSHYDIVYSRRQEATRAYCQSLTYNVLYSSVLGMQDVQIAAVSMLHDNNGSLGPYSDRRDSSASNSPPGCIGSLMEKLGLGDEEDKEQIAAQCAVELEDGTDDTGDKDCSHKSNGECSAVSLSSPSGPVSAVEILNAGDLPFPFRVAKCLDRNIYRNTEYDTWADFEPRHGSCDRRGLQAGVKVLVQLSAVPFKARLLALRDQHLLRTKGGATPPNSSRQEADATTTPNSTQSPTEAITAKDDGATNDALPVSERNKLNKQDDANKPAKGEEGGEVFHGIIREMAENEGPVNVYIEEIASRINVPYDALEPVSPSPTRSPYHKGGGGTSSPSHYPSQGYKGGPGFFHKQAGPIADYGPGRRKGRINSTSGRTAGPLSAPPIAAGGRGGRSGPRQPQNKSFGRDGNGGGPGPGDGYHRNGGGPGGGDSYHRNPGKHMPPQYQSDPMLPASHTSLSSLLAYLSGISSPFYTNSSPYHSSEAPLSHPSMFALDRHHQRQQQPPSYAANYPACIFKPSELDNHCQPQQQPQLQPPPPTGYSRPPSNSPPQFAMTQSDYSSFGAEYAFYLPAMMTAQPQYSSNAEHHPVESSLHSKQSSPPAVVCVTNSDVYNSNSSPIAMTDDARYVNYSVTAFHAALGDITPANGLVGCYSATNREQTDKLNNAPFPPERLCPSSCIEGHGGVVGLLGGGTPVLVFADGCSSPLPTSAGYDPTSHRESQSSAPATEGEEDCVAAATPGNEGFKFPAAPSTGDSDTAPDAGCAASREAPDDRRPIAEASLLICGGPPCIPENNDGDSASVAEDCRGFSSDVLHEGTNASKVASETNGCDDHSNNSLASLCGVMDPLQTMQSNAVYYYYSGYGGGEYDPDNGLIYYYDGGALVYGMPAGVNEKQHGMKYSRTPPPESPCGEAELSDDGCGVAGSVAYDVFVTSQGDIVSGGNGERAYMPVVALQQQREQQQYCWSVASERQQDKNADDDIVAESEAAAEEQQTIAPPPADPPTMAVDAEGGNAVCGSDATNDTSGDKGVSDNDLVQTPVPPLAALAPHRGYNNSSKHNNSSKEYHQPAVPPYQAGGGALMPGGPRGYPYPGGPHHPNDMSRPLYPPRHQFPSPPYGYGPPGRQHYGMQGPRHGAPYTALPHGGGGRYTSPHRGSSGHTPADRGRGQGNNYHSGSKNGGNNNHGGYANNLPPNHGQQYNSRNGDSRNSYGNNTTYGHSHHNNNGGNSSRGNNSSGRSSNGGAGYNRYNSSATSHYYAGDRVPSASGHTSRSMYSSINSLGGNGNSNNTQQRALLPPRLQQRSYYNSNNNTNGNGSNNSNYNLENNKNSRKPVPSSNVISTGGTSGNRSNNTAARSGREPAPGISSPPPVVHVPVEPVLSDAPATVPPVTVAETSVTTTTTSTPSTTTGVTMAAVTSGHGQNQKTVPSHISSGDQQQNVSGHYSNSSGHHGQGITSTTTTSLIPCNPSVYPARPHSASTLHGKVCAPYGSAAYPPHAFAHQMSSYLSSLSGYVRSPYEGQPLLNMGSLRRPQPTADPYPVAPPPSAPVQALPMMAAYQGEGGMTTMVPVYHVPGTSGAMVPSMACYPPYQAAGEASCPAGMMMSASLHPPPAQHYYTPGPPSAGGAAPLIYPGHHHGTPGQWVVSSPGHLMPHSTVPAAAYPQPYPSPMMGAAPISGYSYSVPRPPTTYMPH